MLKHVQSSRTWSDKSLGAKGFTLIELLVVIVILGVLGAVVVFSVRGVTDDSKQNACATERRTIATAAEAYYANSTPSAYPADTGVLKTSGLLNDSVTELGTWQINQTTGKVTGTCEGTTYS